MPIILPPTASQIIDQALAAHRAAVRGSAKIVVQTQTKGGKQSQVADLRYIRPDRVLLRLKGGGSDRTFFLQGKSLIGYDAVQNEYLTRGNLIGPDAAQRLSGALGGLAEPTNLLISPAAMSQWIGQFVKTGWTVSRSPAATVLSKGTASAGVRIGFDPKTRLLRTGQFVNGPSKMSWRIDYGPAPSSVVFRVPPTAAKVETFRVQTKPVHYRTADARKAVEKMLRAGAKLTKGVVVAKGEEGTVRMAFDSNAFHERGPELEWTFDGQTLTIRKGHVLYRGTARKSSLLDLVAAVGGRIDPFLRDVVTGSVPFEEFLSSRSVVSIGGEVTVGGLPCTIVSIAADLRRSSLFVRPDGLVQSSATDLLDEKGGTVTTSSRQYLYAPLPRNERFLLSPSGSDSVRPLPTLPKRKLPSR